MLYIDGISLNKIAKELREELLNKKIGKIVQTSSLAITLSFGKTNFVVSAFPNLSLAYISEKKEDNFLEENTGFCLNLRKHLLGSTLLDVEEINFDRILVFHFSKLNELGVINHYKLYFEPMGKHSNIILTDKNNKIIDLIKRFSLEENSLRFLFPGVEYSLPILEKKISPMDLTEIDFYEYKNEGTLISKVNGIGKYLLNNLDSYENFRKILNDTIAPKIFYKDKELILGTVLNIEPKNYTKVISFETSQEMINYYLENKNLSNSYKLLKDKLIAITKKNIKKIERTIKTIEKEIEDRENYDRYRELGDILAASLYSLKKGMDKVDLYDFYKDEMCTISLDPLLTPQSNLEKIYKKYNKTKKGLEYSLERVVEFKNNLDYFKGLELFIESSENLENLKIIEEELISQKFIKLPKTNKKKQKKQIKEYNYGKDEIDGYTIYFGRNNLENDNLTMKIANREEYWFHAKDVPGSHIILKSETLPKDETLIKIATLAGKMSRSNPGDKVTIDYTKKKYINKPKGAKPGFVTYNIFDSIIVTI
ncbi:Rqc2 family fibronectin-binding protein [Cetobacterium ceti]